MIVNKCRSVIYFTFGWGKESIIIDGINNADLKHKTDNKVAWLKDKTFNILGYKSKATIESITYYYTSGKSYTIKF